MFIQTCRSTDSADVGRVRPYPHRALQQKFCVGRSRSRLVKVCSGSNAKAGSNTKSVPRKSSAEWASVFQEFRTKNSSSTSSAGSFHEGLDHPAHGLGNSPTGSIFRFPRYQQPNSHYTIKSPAQMQQNRLPKVE